MNPKPSLKCQMWDAYNCDPCPELARFRWANMNLCPFHYGGTNKELGIPKPDEVAR